MPTMSGDWNHNSYLVEPTTAQFNAAPPSSPPPPAIPASRVEVDAFKWAKGTFQIDTGSSTKGKLIFVAGVAELVVTFSLESGNGQTVFRGQGVGESGPLNGVVYDLLGWATVDGSDNVTGVAGGILAVKGGPGGAGLGGQPVGTVGYFKLSK